MIAEGASPQAVDFMKSLKAEGYLAGFRETGVVDIGTIFSPSRANTNEYHVFLNGRPRMLSTEFMWNEISIKQDPVFRTIVAQYPEADLETTRATFVRVETSGGRQRFIFLYPITNGCRACGTDWEAQIAFDFDDAGKYLAKSLLKLSKRS